MHEAAEDYIQRERVFWKNYDKEEARRLVDATIVKEWADFVDLPSRPSEEEVREPGCRFGW